MSVARSKLSQWSMGRKIACHHGKFILPSDIYSIDIGDNSIQFRCEDGIYEASLEDKWKINKVSDEPI